MYDISDDDLPQDVKHGLQAKGWRFDASAQEWRKYNDADQHFSPVPGDHQRIWASDVTAVVAEIAAGEVKEPFPGAESLSSKQVQDNDEEERRRRAASDEKDRQRRQREEDDDTSSALTNTIIDLAEGGDFGGGGGSFGGGGATGSF